MIVHKRSEEHFANGVWLEVSHGSIADCILLLMLLMGMQYEMVHQESRELTWMNGVSGVSLNSDIAETLTQDQVPVYQLRRWA